MSVSQRTIERDLSYLQNHGILKHEGSDKKIIFYFVFLSERDTFTEDK
jgi:predicted DNA-binding transcriptional regulator YafY